jgi:sRNA-binding protein
MAFSRTAVLLFMLPVPAAVYLATSTEDVNASGQCLPSAEAVHQQYPGSWASWTGRAANHNGQKCWFPVMRESHSHHAETALRRAAQKMMRRDEQQEEQRQHDRETARSDKSDKAVAESPAAPTAEMNGWSLRTGSAPVATSVAPADDSSSFEDRFAAARNVTSVRKPSAIQRMMDPVGAVPDIP